jgi:hypothetical protein
MDLESDQTRPRCTVYDIEVVGSNPAPPKPPKAVDFAQADNKVCRIGQAATMEEHMLVIGNIRSRMIRK